MLCELHKGYYLAEKFCENMQFSFSFVRLYFPHKDHDIEIRGMNKQYESNGYERYVLFNLKEI